MRKTFESDKGGTLLLVIMAIMLISIIVIPLVMITNTGFMQTRTDAHLVQATTRSESAIRVFKRMFTETKVTNTDVSDIDTLVRELGTKLFPEEHFDVVPDLNGLPVEIVTTTTRGSGQIQRSKRLPLVILRFPSSTGSGGGEGPAAGSTGNEFYHTTAVVVSDPVHKKLFHACGNPDEPTEMFYDTEVDNDNDKQDKFQEDYAKYINYYTSRNITAMIGDVPTANFSERQLPRTPDAVPSFVQQLNNTVTQSTITYDRNSSVINGVDHAGHIIVRENYSSKTFNSLPNGVAIKSSGDLRFDGHINDNMIQVNGGIHVGQNFIVGGMGSLTFNGDVYVRGNATFGGMSSLTINGNLYVNGDLSFSAINNSLTINGKVIVGGNASFGQGNITVKESLSSAGNLSFTGTTPSVTVGQWNGNTIASNDQSYLVAGNLLSVNKIEVLKVPDHISANTFDGEINTLIMGGSFLTQGGATIKGTVTDWQIADSMSIGGVLQFTGYIYKLAINQSVHAVTSITFVGIGTNLDVGGSVTTSGNISFTGNSTSVNIHGNILTNGQISFHSIASFKVGGSLLVSGNIVFNSNIALFDIRSDIVTRQAVSFRSIHTLNVGGSLQAMGTITFSSNITSVQISGDINTNTTVSFTSIATLHIGGSIHSAGSITFGSNMAYVQIDKDIISKSAISFASISTLIIGGTVAAIGNLDFTNTFSTVTVGGDIMTSGNMNFQTIQTKFIVGGILGASQNVTFNNNIRNAENKLGGYYAGGTTVFPSWFNNNDVTNVICIEYKSRSGGDGGGAGIEFGS